MTTILLLDLLIEELNALLSGYKLKNEDDQLVPINIYPYSRPAKESEPQYPFIIVRPQSGNDSDSFAANECKILFNIGIHDKSKDYQGYKDVLNIIDKIYYRLFTKVIFGDQFTVVRPFDWELEEDDYPYFQGWIETNWEYPKVTLIPENYL